MADYTEDINGAYVDILEAGFLGEIRRNTGTIDPKKGTRLKTYESTPAAMVTVPSVDSLIRFDSQFREAMVKGNARVFLVAAKDMIFEPKPGDNIVFKSKLWKIGSGKNGGVMPLAPDGTAIMFTCGCMVGGEDPDAGTDVT